MTLEQMLTTSWSMAFEAWKTRRRAGLKTVPDGELAAANSAWAELTECCGTEMTVEFLADVRQEIDERCGAPFFSLNTVWEHAHPAPSHDSAAVLTAAHERIAELEAEIMQEDEAFMAGTRIVSDLRRHIAELEGEIAWLNLDLAAAKQAVPGAAAVPTPPVAPPSRHAGLHAAITKSRTGGVNWSGGLICP